MREGEYIAKLGRDSLEASTLEGLINTLPVSTMIFDGKTCQFFKCGELVWNCSLEIAQKYFTLKPISKIVKQ